MQKRPNPLFQEKRPSLQPRRHIQGGVALERLNLCRAGAFGALTSNERHSLVFFE